MNGRPIRDERRSSVFGKEIGKIPRKHQSLSQGVTRVSKKDRDLKNLSHEKQKLSKNQGVKKISKHKWRLTNKRIKVL